MSEDNGSEVSVPVKRKRGGRRIPDGQPMSRTTEWRRRKAAGLVQERDSQGRIPDGQPMSLWTIQRRKKAAGLTRTLVHHHFNYSFFDVWSAELAWLLGLIWSDGCLRSKGNSVEIVSKDLCLLQTVAGLIEIHDGIRPRKGGTDNREGYWYLGFSDKGVADILRGLGLTPAKSLNANWPYVPHEYFGDFLRGLIDGDGWVTVRNYKKGQQVPDLVVALCGAAPNVLSGVSIESQGPQNCTFSYMEKAGESLEHHYRSPGISQGPVPTALLEG